MLARVVNLGLLVAVAITIPLSHHALSQKKGKAPPKVAICHYPDDSDTGHVINISPNAVPAHLSKHGDCEDYTTDEATGACICPTCEERCNTEHDVAECVAAGGTQEDCEAALEACLDACTPCEDDCETAFEECLAAGGTQEDCDAARTECLAACGDGAGG